MVESGKMPHQEGIATVAKTLLELFESQTQLGKRVDIIRRLLAIQADHDQYTESIDLLQRIYTALKEKEAAQSRGDFELEHQLAAMIPQIEAKLREAGRIS